MIVVCRHFGILGCCNCFDRKTNPKIAAHALLTFHSDLPVQRFDKAARNAQAQSGSTNITVIGRITGYEIVKNTGLNFGIYANSCVAHTNHDFWRSITVGNHLKLDRNSPIMGKFHGIPDQIDQYMLNPFFIGVNPLGRLIGPAPFNHRIMGHRGTALAVNDVLHQVA